MSAKRPSQTFHGERPFRAQLQLFTEPARHSKNCRGLGGVDKHDWWKAQGALSDALTNKRTFVQAAGLGASRSLLDRERNKRFRASS